MARPSKNPTDLAPSTFARKRESRQLPWLPLYDEECLQICRSGIKDTAVRTWLALRPVLNNNDRRGYLTIDIPTLALVIGNRRPAKLAEDIEQLITIGILERDENGEIYSTWVVSDVKSRSFENDSSGNPDVIFFDEKSQRVESEEPSKKSDGAPEKFRKTVQYSTLDNSDAPSARVDVISSSATAPTSPAGVAAGASADYWEQLNPDEYPHIPNLRKAVEKWERLSEEKGWPKMLVRLGRFLEMEREFVPKSAEPKKPKLNKRDSESVLAHFRDDFRKLEGCHIPGKADEMFIKRIWTLTGNCSEKVCSDAFAEGIYEGTFVYYTSDKHSEQKDDGVSGADTCQEDSRGIMRRIGSRWLDAGAYDEAELDAA
jgi:hypothetical protein